MFTLILATDDKQGIAKNNQIPWNIPEDLQFFKRTTEGHFVIMGRKTYQTLPTKNRPLSNRINVVITTTMEEKCHDEGCMVFSSVNACINYFSTAQNHQNKKLFVIGGESLYKQFLATGYVKDVYHSKIQENHKCDQFFDTTNIRFDNYKILAMWPWGHIAHFTIYNHEGNPEEQAILDLMKKIITRGNKRGDRTGTGTMSVFSHELRFDLSNGHIPMMTTRPLSLRIIFEELMWILRGQTDNRILQDKKIHIWDDNTTQGFIDKQKLPYREGDIGPSYGWQMRRFGEDYPGISNQVGSIQTCDKTEPSSDYKPGFDQLNHVINLLRNNPESRRIVINLWNPSQVKKMTLPPCVYGYQFYVTDGRLSCKMIQRSSDIALAGSHNCAAGALFVRLLCSVTGLKPGELIWSPADTHIYLNQINAVRVQIERKPTKFPLLEVTAPDSGVITDFKYSNLKLINYNPQPKIKFEMNA